MVLPPRWRRNRLDYRKGDLRHALRTARMALDERDAQRLLDRER